MTRTDWWDTGNQQHYKEILLLRHTHVNEKRLRALRRLKVPDISTWQGQYRRNGAPVAGHDGARNELYEVKPDTVWGEAAGKEKLKGIDDNFNELAVSGYHRGSWYPDPPGPTVVARKQLHFQAPNYVIASFHYSLRRLVRAVQRAGAYLEIRDVVLEIERREAGLLYYMICVQLTLDFNGEERVAKKIVQRLYKALSSRASSVDAALETAFADSLAASGRDRKTRPPQPPDTLTQKVLAAIAVEEQYRIAVLDIVDELQDAVGNLARALFSRLRGLPGDRSLVCSDEVYFNNEIMGPRKARMAAQIRPLQLRPPIPIPASCRRSRPPGQGVRDGTGRRKDRARHLAGPDQSVHRARGVRQGLPVV